MIANTRSSRKPVWCLVALLGISGCFGGGESLPELAEVTGTINLNGSPLPGASVVFLPKEGGSAFALTDANGKFELMYNQDTAGAVLGSYTVKVSKEKNPEEPGMDLVPKKYNEMTTLTAEVKSGAENDFQFDLSSK
ncbi:carboxypeptidase-like regulatory domain-containing protein [uncultured Gimesia sp.]|uniref:carboxypeptidase-like regulatory domain-containing protein n=1 Tax=uncultured Gimesia sp. TaxID=1678688 RepID=UPI0030DA3736|tara:strand:- start:38310 stop:38720 length:411 start_codon:yes stop_codon:yes gene_type:complete